MALGRKAVEDARKALTTLRADISSFEKSVTNLNDIFASNDDYQKFSKETKYGASLEGALQEIIELCRNDITNELRDLEESTKVMIDRQEQLGETGE